MDMCMSKLYKKGPWHDYVNVQWEEYGLIPARLLAFYNEPTKEEDDQIMVLVHSCILIKMVIIHCQRMSKHNFNITLKA